MKLNYYILILLFFISCSKHQDKILPEEQSLTESVYSSVIVQPDSMYHVYSAVAGIVENNLVEEGDLVSTDDALIQIINQTPILNTQNARLSLELAKENYEGGSAILEGIQEEIASAVLKNQNDSINYFRQINLWNQKIGSKADYDNKKLAYDLSNNSLTVLRSKYNRTKNELQTAVKQAQNVYKASLINTKDFTVKSKINGKVYSLNKEPGEIVTTMEPLATVGSATDFVMEMLVDEVDIVRIQKSQDIVITLDAYSGKVFTGNVSKIYPKKDERNQTFKIEALFNDRPLVLYPGLSGEANIIIAKKENVLTIPKAYLIEENKVRTDDGIISVTTGLKNMEYIEILSGISKSTYIYKPKE